MSNDIDPVKVLARKICREHVLPGDVAEAAIRATVDLAILAANAERLTDETGQADDVAYNRAIDDVIERLSDLSFLTSNLDYDDTKGQNDEQDI